MRSHIGFLACLLSVFLFDSANAAITTVKPNNGLIMPSATPVAAPAIMLDGMPSPEEREIIKALENDIDLLDAEIAKCEKQKKGWIAATVIGSAGTLSTGVAAIVQGVQISKQKKTMSEQQTQLQGLQTEKNKLGIQ